MLRFLGLLRVERRLLADAAFMLAAASVGVRIGRLATVRRWLARLSVISARGSEIARQRIIWAVDAASRRIPGAGTCLPRALAAQAMLARHGFPASFRIGVGRTDDGTFVAHAWVESDGEVVIGGGDLARYRS